MLKQVFLSQALAYRQPGQGGFGPIPTGIGVGALYNPELVDPPRVYAETLNRINGIAVIREATADSQTVILVFGWTDQIYWPSFDRWFWKFDAETGAFLGAFELGATYYDYAMFQSRDGSLWQVQITGGFFEFSPTTLEAIEGTERDADEFGYVAINTLIVDKQADLVILAGTGHDDYLRSMTVHTLSTGVELRQIYLAGQPAAILPEDGTRCYVITTNEILHLVDYTTGEVISTVRAPFSISSGQTVCWDTFTRRLLWFDKQDDAADGSGQSVIRGYYPIPKATHMTTPIPLRPPRRGRQIPVLLRTVGDLGEPLAGVTPSLTATGEASVQRAPTGTDSNGDAIAYLLCNEATSVTLNATATVDDGL
jgi:hypothetical protein